MKRRRNQRNKSRIEDNKDMLSNLPDGVLLHILSFLNTKEAVQTCILSIRWKHLWRYLPTLTLSCRNFRTLKCFTKFVTQILSLRDASTALTALDFKHFDCVERHLLNRIVRYAISHNVNYLRLSCRIEHLSPSLFSCLPLTSLDLAIPSSYYSRQIFPNSLNLPALTYLKLNNLSFCSGSDGRVEPFSTFNSLNILILHRCKVFDAKPLCISSTTLLNLSIDSTYYSFIVELFAPNLCTFALSCNSIQQLSGRSHLSSIKHVNIDIFDVINPVETTLGQRLWLTEMTDIKSLTITPTTLQALSLIPDILKLKLPFLCNMKSLLLNLSWESDRFSASSWSVIKMELAGGKAWKENAKLREIIKAGLGPIYSSIREGMIDFLLQNSPSAKVEIVKF